MAVDALQNQHVPFAWYDNLIAWHEAREEPTPELSAQLTRLKQQKNKVHDVSPRQMAKGVPEAQLLAALEKHANTSKSSIFTLAADTLPTMIRRTNTSPCLRSDA